MKEADYEFEIEEGDKTWSFIAKLRSYRDNYGQDADGNRGMPITVIEVDEIIPTDPSTPNFLISKAGEYIDLQDDDELSKAFDNEQGEE